MVHTWLLAVPIFGGKALFVVHVVDYEAELHMRSSPEGITRRSHSGVHTLLF